MTFAVDLKTLTEKAKGNAHAVTRKVVLEIGGALVIRSPVGDAKYWKSPPPPGYVGGRFRANWQYGEGSINSTTTTAIDRNEYATNEGAADASGLSAKVGVEAGGKIHYLTNSLPYGPALENGHSRQAPFGMAGVTALEFNLFVNRAVSQL